MSFGTVRGAGEYGHENDGVTVMDIAGATSVPFMVLHRFHEAFNRHIKVTTASLMACKRLMAGTHGPDVLDAFIRQTEEPWKASNHFKNPDDLIDQSVRLLTEAGMAQVFSSLDVFLDGVEAEMNRCFVGGDLASSDSPCAAVEDQDDRVARVAHRHDLYHEAIQKFYPLLKYFRLLRHCVVHRSGRVSASLSDWSRSGELAECLRGWPRRSTRVTLPTFPALIVGQPVVGLLPRHAILASDVCHRVGQGMNQRLCEKLGVSGIVRSAVHHALVDPIDSAMSAKARTPCAAVNDFLTRHRVREVNGPETIAILRRLGLWNRCKESHSQVRARAT